MISGSISGHWTARDNPYQLTANALVEAGDTLTMDSAVPDAISFHLTDINNDYLFDVNDVVAIIDLLTGG
ncbi:MAG: hypothetical protein U9Q77_07695 [Candidatus Marinimicrobia bacterium]|nr:hypothetical protein [Candidatus Neomarinimicrobiota bacterium]